MDERDREGTAATLRAAALIVIVGIVLGLAFNAVGLAGRPPRGLPWIRQPERMPSLEDLQPASVLAPSGMSGWLAGLDPVGAAWAGTAPSRATVADTARAARKPAVKPATKAAKPAVTKKTTKAPVSVVRIQPQPVKPAIQKTGTTPPPAVAIPLPVVPDLDQPIEVKLANVKRFFDAGPTAAVIVDARESEEYAAAHIAGAISLPYEAAIEKPERLAPFKNLGRPIIVYCDGGDCEVSKDLAKSMLAEGIRKVLVFTDGLPAWKSAGYPVETGATGAQR